MDNVEIYPLDVAALQKGDTIDIPRLERITGERAGTDAYRFKVLALRDRIIRERRDANEPVTVAVRRDALAILTDEEASEYNNRLFHQRVRQLLGTHLREMEVDASNLSDEQKERHEGFVVSQSRLVQALLAEKKKLALEPTRRTVPGIVVEGQD